MKNGSWQAPWIDTAQLPILHRLLGGGIHRLCQWPCWRHLDGIFGAVSDRQETDSAMLCGDQRRTTLTALQPGPEIQPQLALFKLDPHIARLLLLFHRQVAPRKSLQSKAVFQADQGCQPSPLEHAQIKLPEVAFQRNEAGLPCLFKPHLITLLSFGLKDQSRQWLVLWQGAITGDIPGNQPNHTAQHE